MTVDEPLILDAVTCAVEHQYTDISLPNMKMIENHENIRFLEAEWENQLKHQVSVLLPLDVT